MNKKNRSSKELIPGDIFHPGEVILDELEARDMSQQDLADKMALSKSEISLLLHGHRNITPMIAVLLEGALGIDAEIWMNLQVKYDIDLVRKKAKRAIDIAKISPSQKNRLRKVA
ncbi:MAG: HigA family addiction module antidote protein [Phycisphaeraceae bacterium]|nr:HigA family addiction module antidote protein [Phycisphaeraceae bacterium]